jgi:hypothetical protein
MVFIAQIQGFMSGAAEARRWWKRAVSRKARIAVYLLTEQAAARITYLFYALLSWAAVHINFDVMPFLMGPVAPEFFGPTMLRWLKNLTAERVPASFEGLGLDRCGDDDSGGDNRCDGGWEDAPDDDNERGGHSESYAHTGSGSRSTRAESSGPEAMGSSDDDTLWRSAEDDVID